MPGSNYREWRRFGATKPLSATWTPHYANIIAYWPLDGTVGDIANGATIPATIGPNATAITVSSASLNYVAGIINNAISFDGSYGSITVPYDMTSNEITITVWVKRNATGVFEYIVTSLSADWYIGFDASDFVIFGVQSGDWSVQSTNTITDTANWHLIVCNFSASNAGQVEIYIDGVLDASTSTASSMFFAGGSYGIGSTYAGSTNFSGSIDQLSTWLDPELKGLFDTLDVSDLWNGGVGLDIATYTPPHHSSLVLTFFFPLSGTLGIIQQNDVIPENFGQNGVAQSRLPMAYVSGKIAQDIRFNLNGASFSDTGFPTGTSNRSFCCWFKTTEPNNSAGEYFFSYGGFSATNWFGLTLYNNVGGSSSGVAITQYGDAAFTSYGLNDGNWHHFAFTFDGTTSRLYVDGVLNVTNNTMSWNTTLGGTGYLGSGSGQPGLQQNLDEVALWNVTLSDADILTIYNHQK